MYRCPGYEGVSCVFIGVLGIRECPGCVEVPVNGSTRTHITPIKIMAKKLSIIGK